MSEPPDFDAIAKDLLVVELDGRPEGISVRDAMYFQIRDALRRIYDQGARDERRAIVALCYAEDEKECGSQVLIGSEFYVVP